MENIINTSRSFKIRTEWLTVLRSITEKKLAGGGSCKRRENKKFEQNFGWKTGREEEIWEADKKEEKESQGVFYLVMQWIAKIM